MGAPVTMLALVHDVEDLDRRPQPADLTAEHESSTLGLTARLTSVVAGLVVGCFAAAVALVPFTLLSGDILATVVALVTGAVVALVLRRASGLDVRIAFATAALVPLACAVLHPSVAHFGGRLVVGTVAAVLVYFSALASWKIRQARADLTAWNRAYAHLAEDPRRATAARPSMQREPAGAAHRFTGTVDYVDDAGQTRTVPLTSALGLQLVYAEDQVATDASPCVVWHSADHAVVLTVVLMDRDAV